MAKKITNYSTKENFISKLNTTWATIIAGCTIFGLGYGAASVVLNVFHKIEINEINQKQNEQLYSQKKDFDIKVEELIHEKHLLEIENGNLRKK